MEDLVPGAQGFDGLVAELAAADDLITELVAENEELRSRLAHAGQALADRACFEALDRTVSG